MAKSRLVIFTDLDGTLLDHDSYDFKPATAVLHRLRQLNAIVIPTSSKTRFEIEPLMADLGIQAGFICENGAAIYLFDDAQIANTAEFEPDGHLLRRSFCQPRKYWLQQLKVVAAEFDGLYRQFSQMSLTEIAKLTGLSPVQALRAAQREYTEPLLWLGSAAQAQEFIACLAEQGIQGVFGGRFLTIGGQHSKGQAMAWLQQQIQAAFPHQQFTSVALGDGQNDISMLRQADIAVRIKNPHNPLFDIEHPNLLTSTFTGPQGWAECMQQILATEE